MDEALMQRIRERAHEIWVQEGRQHGRDQDHWEQAKRELAHKAGDAVETVETEAQASVSGKSGRGGRVKKTASASTASEVASTAKQAAGARKR